MPKLPTNGRSVEEWVGKTPDSVPPVAVKLRVFARAGGRCHLTGVKIQPGDEWDLDHVKPLHLAAPGETLNRESNLAPALRAPHRAKTAAENISHAQAHRVLAKHFGIWPKSRTPIRSRGFAKTRPTIQQEP